MCAISAKSHNPKLNIAIIEKNNRVGKKLLSTGNGRCNLTNVNVSPDKYTGSFSDYTAELLKKYSADALLEYFKRLGLLTYSDSEGRCYPVSKQASSVLDVLRYNAERLGVEILCSQDIHSVSRQNGFVIKTADTVIYCEKLVICCGSKAAPKLGGSAGGLDYLRNFGHSVTPFSSALCPVNVESRVLKSLKGLRASGTAELCRNSKTLKKETGEIQFTENALSGICVFNLSLYAKENDVIKLDIVNFISNKELYLQLQNNKKLFGLLPSESIFTGILQKRLALAVVKLSGVNLSKPIKDLSGSELEALAYTAKNMNFKVTGKAGFEQAQSSLGGVKGSEIVSKTMMSKKVKNLFVCGEVIDICGECGGYNLHFAFSSGIIAGESL